MNKFRIEVKHYEDLNNVKYKNLEEIEKIGKILKNISENLNAHFTNFDIILG